MYESNVSSRGRRSDESVKILTSKICPTLTKRQKKGKLLKRQCREKKKQGSFTARILQRQVEEKTS